MRAKSCLLQYFSSNSGQEQMFVGEHNLVSAGFPHWLCHCLAKRLLAKACSHPMGLNSCQESSPPRTCPLPELICCLDLHTIQQFSCAGSSAKLNVLCITISSEKC